MIWISQWLCPQRHASIALAWDDSDTSVLQIEAAGEDLYRRGIFNRWCGICRGDLNIEHGRTAFQTMDEAQPFLKECQQANLAARVILGNKF